MDYLKIIERTYYSHKIAKSSSLKSATFKKTDKYPTSEGIKFENTDFAGEIFYYANEEMDYCEMSFLIYNGEKYDAKVINKPNESELRNAISDFLTINLTELKNVG